MYAVLLHFSHRTFPMSVLVHNIDNASCYILFQDTTFSLIALCLCHNFDRAAVEFEKKAHAGNREQQMALC